MNEVDVFGPSDERQGGMADGARHSEGANPAMSADASVGITADSSLAGET